MITDNDKQRIEQEAEKYASKLLDNYPHEDFTSGAEYATIYERQQNAELRNKVIEEVVGVMNDFFIEGRFGGDFDEGDLIRKVNSLKTK